MLKSIRCLVLFLLSSLILTTALEAADQPSHTASGTSRAAVRLELPGVPHALALRATVPGSPVALALDDGSSDNDIGIGGTHEFLFLNRFTPEAGEYPFALEQVQVYFNTSGMVNVGDHILLAIYENRSGNTDPAVGSQLLATFPTTIHTLDTWNVYSLPTPVVLNGPGDVLIGVIALELRGANYWPASIDLTSTHQRSWAGWWNASPPNPPSLPPDNTWIMVDTYFPGNWLIRGAGHVQGTVPDLHSIGQVAVTEGGRLEIDLTVDNPEPRQSLTFSADLLPEGAHLDPSTGVFLWRPRYDQAGIYNVTFTVINGVDPELSDSITVAITVNDITGPIFVDTFDVPGDLTGDPDWGVLSGKWRATTKGKLVTGAAKSGMAKLALFSPAEFPLGPAIISAGMKLTSNYGRYANAAIVFGWQDVATYRYVRIQAGKVLIGQVGDLGSEGAGVKAQKSEPSMKIGKWHPVTVRVHPSGLVEVFEGDLLLTSYTFAEVAAGGVGLMTSKATSQFDDFTILQYTELR